jgi:hypothetical protein
MLVMGRMRESRQDFKRDVGMMSKEQVEFEDLRMKFRISRGVARVNEKRVVGGVGGGEYGSKCCETGKEAVSLEIFSEKKVRKEEARVDGSE